MRWPFANSFSRTQQVRRSVGALALGLSALLCVGAVIFQDALKEHKLFLVWYWLVMLMALWLGVVMALWDLFDVLRRSALERRKTMVEHFSDAEYLNKIRKKTAEQKKEKDNEQ